MFKSGYWKKWIMKKVDIEKGGYWKKVVPALIYVRPCQMSESEHKKLKHHCWE